MRRLKTVILIAGCVLLFVLPLRAQSRGAKCEPSLDLANMQHTPPKGRLQEAGAPQTKHILELGKKAIPLLIACLTDQTRTKEPIEDFWPVTTVGDIAFFYLCDLSRIQRGNTRPSMGSSPGTHWRTNTRAHPHGRPGTNS